MHCPSCGYPIDQQSLDHCPQCGRSRTAPADQRIAASAPFADTGSPSPSVEPVEPVEPVAPNMQTPPQSPYTPYVQPGQSGAYPSAPGSYDQSAPPSYPPPGGSYQPAYPPVGYAQPPSPYMYPSSPQRKNHTGLIVGIVAATVVLLVACTGGTLFAVHSLGRTSAAAHRPAASPTLSASKVYSNTFTSSADDWTVIPQHCFLANDGFHAAGGYYCTVPVAEQDNVDVTVNVRQVSGPTNWSYGLFFRQQDKDNDYAFMINSSGEWVFVRCVNADCTTPVYFTANDAIKPGLDTTNTIEVRATGPHFVFFVNGTQVGSYDDTALTFGRVSLFASGTAIDCAFTDLVITRPD